MKFGQPTTTACCALLFSLFTHAGSQAQFTKLHDFSGGADGSDPIGGVAVSGTTIYGTANVGGANNGGTIWSFDTANDTYAKLHDFDSPGPPPNDGFGPRASVAVSGTTIYGTAVVGGADNGGTIWSFDIGSDTFTKLHDFSGDTDGMNPAGGVAVSGTTIFGTAASIGANNSGTIWSFDTASDTLTKLHDFTGDADGNGPNGGVAVSGTTIFGTAASGGANGSGTIWSFDTASDTFTNLHDLRPDIDGGSPWGDVAVSGTTIFGTAASGGANGMGTIWSFDTASNTFTNLHDFTLGNPVGVAVSGSTIFGTSVGGLNTIWSFDAASDTFTNLHEFNVPTDGIPPLAPVAFSGATIFGASAGGGTNNEGTIWAFVVPEPTGITLGSICALTLLSYTRHRRRGSVRSRRA